ncbi:hypothetical protein CEXT_350391 [Caerostris extrusa]|uniref:Uncharacterized protein n=1 Tax=Caerostris extrusa TaxID=172846 RepID=A0AAV4Y3W3_CAEEX|nr:hypothetical protein CEXT_350391 [Caerostris extrusa]
MPPETHRHSIDVFHPHPLNTYLLCFPPPSRLDSRRREDSADSSRLLLRLLLSELVTKGDRALWGGFFVLIWRADTHKSNPESIALFPATDDKWDAGGEQLYSADGGPLPSRRKGIFEHSGCVVLQVFKSTPLGHDSTPLGHELGHDSTPLGHESTPLGKKIRILENLFFDLK